MRPRVPVIACLVAGAALLAIALFGHRWGALDPDGRVGLYDTICARGPGCAAGTHGATTATRIEGEQFARLGQAALILGVLAMLAAIGAVFAGGAPRLRRWLAAPTIVLALGALGAATAFTVTEPFGQFDGLWHPGAAWWLALAGAALVAAGVGLDGPAAAPARPPAIALAASALLLALTARSTSWWHSTPARADLAGAIGVGPAMVDECDGDLPCAEERLGDLASSMRGGDLAPQAELMAAIADGAVAWPRVSRATIVAGRALAVGAALAAALAAALGIALAFGRRARLLAWLALAADGALVVAIVAFEAGRPAGRLAPVLGVVRSYGLPLALAGVAAAVAPAILSLRSLPRAPVDAPAADVPPPPLLASATAAEIPPCPACRAPMLWISRRRTWMCTLCKARDSVAT